MSATLDVLVAGAGPTGLTLACDLARRGVAVRIVEKTSEFPTAPGGKGSTRAVTRCWTTSA